jgi:hypothetical protein
MEKFFLPGAVMILFFAMNRFFNYFRVLIERLTIPELRGCAYVPVRIIMREK